MDQRVLAKTVESISRVLTGSSVWEEDREELLKQCSKLFGADACAIFLIRGHEVVLNGHIGYTRFNRTAIPIEALRQGLKYEVTSGPPYNGVTGYVASTGKPWAMDAGDRPDIEFWLGKPDELKIWDPKERPFRCMYAVPLMSEGEPIGVLKVENKTGLGDKPEVFDEVDKETLGALANLFSIAVRLSFYRGLPYDNLFTTTMEWLATFDRRNLYQNMVEFCASIFEGDVCALFVRTRAQDGSEQVELAAGRLQDGRRMHPNDFPNAENATYRVGKDAEGVTGRIATDGVPVLVQGYQEVRAVPGHVGKWDTVVWGGDARSGLLCMMGVPVMKDGEPIGVLKLERAMAGRDRDDVYTYEDLDLLSFAAAGLSSHIADLISEEKPLGPEAEHEYRLIRPRKEEFEQKTVGEVVIRHRLTSICQSDLFYFRHQKSPKKLDHRLPMALGHETVGEILRVDPDARYRDHVNGTQGDIIRTGDRVFVIPLDPCGTCDVCTSEGERYENYCASSKFMASNAPGSLRTSYPYGADLVLKIDDDLDDELAVFTEPMANVVNLLDELGFQEKKPVVKLDLSAIPRYDFEYFHVEGEAFTGLFDTIVENEPNPRTIYVAKNREDSDLGVRSIRHAHIMTKGLGILGHDKPKAEAPLLRRIGDPRILLLGTSVSSYLLALVLIHIHGIPPKQISVTGRTDAKLRQFEEHIAHEIDGIDTGKKYTEDTVKDAEAAIELIRGGRRKGPGFDVVFECVGGKAVDKHVQIGLELLNDGGILALFGGTDDPFKINFDHVLGKRILIKGSYRGSLAAYGKSLGYISNSKPIQDALSEIAVPPVEIEEEAQLTAFFKAADKPRKKLGRLMIGELR